MFIQSGFNNSNTSFTAVSQKQLQALADVIKKENPDYMKKPVPVAKMYKNGLDFLNGYMDKKTYLSSLNDTLKNFTQNRDAIKERRVQLTEKERQFLNNTAISFELSYKPNKISKEELANYLSILA